MGTVGTAGPATVDWSQAIRISPVPMLLVDLETLDVLEANDAAMALFKRRKGRPLELDGQLTIDDQYADVLHLVATGRLDGFDTRLPSTAFEGAPELRAWVRRIHEESDVSPQAIIVVTEGRDIDPSVSLPGGQPALLVAGMTDAEWRIEWITREVKAILGYERKAILGTPLLAIVHPDSAADLVTALGHVHEGDGSAAVPVRLRREDGEWSTHQMILSPRPGDVRGVMFLLCPPHPVDASPT